MRGPRFDRLMSGVALALPLLVFLAIPSSDAQASTETPAAIESAVPMPESTTLPPPTASDAATPSETEGIGSSTEPPATVTAPAENTESAPTEAAPAETATTPPPAAPLAPAETTTTTPAAQPDAAPSDTATTAPAAQPDAAPSDAATAAPTAQPDAAPAETTTTAPAAQPDAAPAETTTAAPADAPPVDPLASLDPADRPVAEQLRDMLPNADRTFASRKERQVVEAFYQKRNFAPVWFERGALSARTSAAITRIHASAADGLIPAEYKIPDMAAATSPEAQADAELRLTATLITFTRHLQAGRFPFARMGGEIQMPQEPPDVTAALTKLAEATDVAAAIDEFSPPQPGYRALKAKLAELRGNTGDETKIVQIPDGPMLRLGMEDARVPLLRQRLQVAGDETNLHYDDALVTAVKAYQKSNRMNADGIVGPGTLRSLNGVSAPRRADVIDMVIANMERWRWTPRDLGNAHVMLNIPNYTLRVMHNGKEVWQTRVVVGKPSTATPQITETMKFITVNPTWNVPPSIVRNEYLPALAQDPTVLARMGLKVTYRRDGSVHIYQPPGAANALGRLRFNFPNRFLVYQHDTPDKHLFAHERRAYSHGCMRVQDPAKYAEVLLSIALPNAGYTEQRIRSMFGSAEQNINFPTPIPVHIAYQTAFVDGAGEFQIRPDIYGIDAKTRNLIRSERGVVEPIAERSPVVASNTTPVRRARPREREQQQPRTVGFFEALFGGFSNAAPVPKARIR
ncbi:MAG: L,D-transpeptidase family protein [Rhizobiales bacterium]|nr:L,D-transpeptidase family protein [Hyphomicrobiales bacterium]